MTTLMPELERDLVRAAGRLSTRRRTARVAGRLAIAAALVVAVTLASRGLWEGDDGRPADRILPAVPPPEAPPPRPAFRPVPGTLSDRVSFRFDGIRYGVVGYRARGGMICTRLVSSGGERGRGLQGLSCVNERTLRAHLREVSPGSAGGTQAAHLVLSGYVPAGTSRLEVAGTEWPSRVVLSRPWRPRGWRGEQLRFFYALIDPPSMDAVPRDVLGRIRVVEP